MKTSISSLGSGNRGCRYSDTDGGFLANVLFVTFRRAALKRMTASWLVDFRNRRCGRGGEPELPTTAHRRPRDFASGLKPPRCGCRLCLECIRRVLERRHNWSYVFTCITGFPPHVILFRFSSGSMPFRVDLLKKMSTSVSMSFFNLVPPRRYVAALSTAFALALVSVVLRVLVLVLRY